MSEHPPLKELNLMSGLIPNFSQTISPKERLQVPSNQALRSSCINLIRLYFGESKVHTGVYVDMLNVICGMKDPSDPTTKRMLEPFLNKGTSSAASQTSTTIPAMDSIG